MHDPLDLTLLLEVPDSYPRQAPVDLQPLDEDALADEAEGWDFLEDTVVRGLVEDDGVLGLVLDLALGPLLLLCSLSAARRCGCCLSFGLIREYQDQSQWSVSSSGTSNGHPSTTKAAATTAAPAATRTSAPNAGPTAVVHTLGYPSVSGEK